MFVILEPRLILAPRVSNFFLKKKQNITSTFSPQCHTDQRLELGKACAGDSEPVKGQIVVSLLSREGHGAVVDALGDVSCPAVLLPTGWEERRTAAGRLYYVNHATHSTQWARPDRYGAACHLLLGLWLRQRQYELTFVAPFL
jgi:hypothetical protein